MGKRIIFKYRFNFRIKFLLKDNGSVIISKDYMQLQKFTICAPTFNKNIQSKFAEKRGGIAEDKEEKECECSKERECQLIDTGEEKIDFVNLESYFNH